MAVHVQTVLLLEGGVDLLALGQVGVPFHHGSHAVGDALGVLQEGGIGVAVGLGHEDGRLIVLLLQGLHQQGRVGDVALREHGVGIGGLELEHFRAQVRLSALVLDLLHHFHAVVGGKDVGGVDELLADVGVVGEDGDGFDFLAGDLGGVPQVVEHAADVDGVHGAHPEEVVIAFLGQVVHGGNGGHHGDAVLLADLSGDVGQGGHVAAQQGIALVDGDQLLSHGLGLLGVALVVALDDLQHLAVDAAGGVDLLHGELDAADDVVADGRLVAGVGVHGADLDGVAVGQGCGGKQDAQAGQDGGKFLEVHMKPSFVYYFNGAGR